MNAGGVPKTCKSSAQLIVFVSFAVPRTGRGDFRRKSAASSKKEEGKRGANLVRDLAHNERSELGAADG